MQRKILPNYRALPELSNQKNTARLCSQVFHFHANFSHNTFAVVLAARLKLSEFSRAFKTNTELIWPEIEDAPDPEQAPEIWSFLETLVHIFRPCVIHECVDTKAVQLVLDLGQAVAQLSHGQVQAQDFSRLLK